MELSTTADWLGVVAGIALGAGWLVRLRKWLGAKVLLANQGAAAGSELVAELLDQATSPARRADIHAFIQFRCTEIEAHQTRSSVRSSTLGVLVLGLGLALPFVWRVADLIPWLWWLWWLSLTNYVALVIAFSLFLIANAQLNRIHEGWQTGARNALEERAFSHARKT